ncbi:minor tail protein [Gordonia phage Sour]|uniref:Minor tail protein n=1 Tax=Gordonia phage Sour TaxID=2182349 RepID=A0A2U8UKK3_9CAUD|nr:minor tail protein [Gordonia phage Sour]AWN04232.1 minor tail protein [Gordonia phage Sour]
MSTPPGKTPRTDAEWARLVTQRLSRLEDAQTVRLGPWVLSSREGALLATSASGETLSLGSPSSVDEEAVQGIIRSSGFVTSEQVAEQVSPLQQQVTDQGNSITNIFEDLTDLFTSAQTQQGQIDAAIARLDEIAATSPVTPAYAADIDDMPTCSRDDLIRWVAASHTHGAGSYSASLTTGDVTGASAGTTVSLSATPATYKPSAPTSLSAVAPVDYTPIIVDRNGVVKKLRWRVGNDTALFSIDAYYMALCVYNPDTGNIEKVWDSGNIKDGVANTTTLTEVAVDMGIDQVCTPGQVLFVAHQQIAPGVLQEARTYACKPQAGVAARPGQLLDACYYRTPGNVGSIPSSVSLASLSRRNDCIPWGAVSVDSTGGGA